MEMVRVLTITQDGAYHVVMITDTAGCTGNDTLTVIGLSIDQVETDNIISIFPNPTSGQIHAPSLTSMNLVVLV